MHTIPIEDLAVFTQMCDALTASKLILSDKKIADVLKSIASSEPFCRFMEKCLDGFNYKLEFLKAKTPDPVKPGKFSLKLPQDENAVAFGFCLLCEIDSKELDFTSFLQQYFGLDELFTDGFANFCTGVILPFKNEVLKLTAAADTQHGEVEQPKQSETAEETEKNHPTITVSQKDYARLVDAASELVRNISREPDLSPLRRSEYAYIVSALVRAVKQRDGGHVKALYFALKNLCADYKFLNLKLKNIEKVITDITGDN